jgi:hypothetical protein
MAEIIMGSIISIKIYASRKLRAEKDCMQETGCSLTVLSSRVPKSGAGHHWMAGSRRGSRMGSSAYPSFRDYSADTYDACREMAACIVFAWALFNC